MTTIEETLTKLSEMRLPSMVLAVRELMDTAPGHQLSFEAKLGIVVDREWLDRDTSRSPTQGGQAGHSGFAR